MKKIIKLSLMCAIVYTLVGQSYAEAEKYSPVVKVESYKNIYWKHINKLWWGSASVINERWYILTNNHVVDDWKWGVSDYFNICLTSDSTKKPDCDYTARLIKRNKSMDVALLKIDSKDTSWKDVDFSEIGVLDIDYNYDLTWGKDIYAIWYPSIWAGTITKTKWIVSGTIDYNGYKYLKSDTLIAGGNSGWALISDKWKLIGVPTFGVWGWYEASIWYSVLISEAQKFIQDNINTVVDDDDSLENFIHNKIELDTINDNHEFKSTIVNFSFDKKYELSYYIKNKWFSIQPQLKNKYLPTSMNFLLMNTPELKTEEEYMYFLKENRFYHKGYHKLKTQKIGGVKFYYAINISDTTGGELTRNKMYFSKVSDTKMAILMLHKPLTGDLEVNKKVNKNTQTLLDGLVFDITKLQDIDFSFKILSPQVEIKNTSWLVSNDINWEAKLFFWNLYDTLKINIVELSVRDWKWKTVEEIYKNQTRDIQDDDKSMIVFKWHKWFIVCDNSDRYVTDEHGTDLSQNSCMIQIYEGIMGSNKKEYKIIGEFKMNKNKIEDTLEDVLTFFTNNIIIAPQWTGETKLVNIYKELSPFAFTDLWKQTEDYKKALKKLIQYKLLIDETQFNGDRAIKWREFLVYYYRSKYNYNFVISKNCKTYSCIFKKNSVDIKWKKYTMYSLFQKMNIPLDEYVDTSKVQSFLFQMELILAWVEVKVFSEEWNLLYRTLEETAVFEKIQKQLHVYDKKINGDEIVKIHKLLWWYWDYSFIKRNNILFNKEKKHIIVIPLYSDKNMRYSSTNIEKKTPLELQCSGENRHKCYWVLTKSDMIDWMINHINFALFDEKLKNKERSIIEEE